jgi:membrane glycosyltransferase
MWLIDQIVEEKVRQAQADGTLTDLPGQGKPLVLDDDSMIPETLRVGYRILKNHGVIPEEIQWRQEIRTLEDLLRRVEVADLKTDPNHEQVRKRLHLLQIQVGLERSRRQR